MKIRVGKVYAQKQREIYPWTKCCIHPVTNLLFFQVGWTCLSPQDPPANSAINSAPHRLVTWTYWHNQCHRELFESTSRTLLNFWVDTTVNLNFIQVKYGSSLNQPLRKKTFSFPSQLWLRLMTKERNLPFLSSHGLWRVVWRLLTWPRNLTHAH